MGVKDFDFVINYKWLSRAGQVFGEGETADATIGASSHGRQGRGTPFEFGVLGFG